METLHEYSDEDMNGFVEMLIRMTNLISDSLSTGEPVNMCEPDESVVYEYAEEDEVQENLPASSGSSQSF